MDKSDLLKILHGDIAHISKVNDSDIALFETRVPVNVKNVRKILLSYLNEEICTKDLINWAKFICVRAEYVSPDCDDSDPDYYEDMFYVIQCLSTPEIDGEVNENQVKIYLAELNKYSDEF